MPASRRRATQAQNVDESTQCAPVHAAAQQAAMISTLKRGGGGISGPPRGNSQLQEIWLQVQDPRAHMPKKVPQERTAEEERIRAMSNKERKDELDRLATMRRQRCNWHPSEGLIRRRYGEGMPEDEREEARERLYRRKETSPPRQKVLTGLGHMLDNGEMTAASLVKVSVTHERASSKQPRMRVRVKMKEQEQNWTGLAGRGGKPPELPNDSANRLGQPMLPPESSAASIDGSVLQQDADGNLVDDSGEPLRDGEHQQHANPLRRQTLYQSLTARAYFTNDWKPGDSYRKYKPAKHQNDWANLDGYAVTGRVLEKHEMNPQNDITSFTTGPMHRGSAYVRPLDVKGQLGARAIQEWKEMLRQDYVRPEDNGPRHETDAEIEELRKLLGAGSLAA